MSTVATVHEVVVAMTNTDEQPPHPYVYIIVVLRMTWYPSSHPRASTAVDDYTDPYLEHS